MERYLCMCVLCGNKIFFLLCTKKYILFYNIFQVIIKYGNFLLLCLLLFQHIYVYIQYICIFNIYFFQIFFKIDFKTILINYFYINLCILNVINGSKCINSARLNLCQGYNDGSINSDIRGRREFRLGFMLQFITISASSRVGLLHRRLKSVRIDP